jgi:hypothetical protein
MTHLSSIEFVKLIVKDSEKYPFPIEHIRNQLNCMFISQEEFFYYFQQAYNLMKKKYGTTYAHIFTQVVFHDIEHTLKVEELPPFEYMTFMENVITRLGKISITRIPRDSPDYELLLEMSK